MWSRYCAIRLSLPLLFLLLLDLPLVNAAFTGAEKMNECQRDAAKSCLSTCYPELFGFPCDQSGPYLRNRNCMQKGPTEKSRAFKQADSSCKCRWNPELASLVSNWTACTNGSGAHRSLVPKRVFNAGSSGISCFRIPAIVLASDGTLLAFAEARHGGCGDGQVHEIAMTRSTDKGITWSDVSLIVGNSSSHVGNPYPIALASGRVLLVYVNHTGGQSSDLGGGNGLVFSDDGGVTWSTAHDISEGFGEARGSLPGPGAGIEIKLHGEKRHLLVVSHHGAYGRDYITYSSDGGSSWSTVNHIFAKMDEGTMADLGGGNVLLNMRNALESTRGRGIARSSDGGMSWSEVTYDSALIGPQCQGSLAAFNGLVYFSNPASRGDRSHLTIRRSNNGGKTWASEFVVQERNSAGYSSLVQGPLHDAHGGILYESASPGSIDFALFPLDCKMGVGSKEDDPLVWV